MKQVDARTLACPQPVILTKKALETNKEVVTLVDNETSVQNLQRLGRHLNCRVDVESMASGEFRLRFCRMADEPTAEHQKTTPSLSTEGDSPQGRNFLIGRETLGHGDEQLGRILMKAFLYALTETDPTPNQVILLNSGVKLAFDPETRESLQLLKERGTQIAGCGTCLDFFGLTDGFDLGEVTNMYAIVEVLQGPDTLSL